MIGSNGYAGAVAPIRSPVPLMAIGGDKNDQPYRDQPDEGVEPHHRYIEREHTTLLSGEVGPLPELLVI